MLNHKSTILLVILIISDLTDFENLSGLAHAALNDTGITTCSNATQNGLPCPVTGFPGQDAEYSNGLNNGFSFTKLDANGNALPVTATNHVCVKDNVTGLTWEVKTDDGGLRDKDWTYTWYNSTAATNGGAVGTSSGTSNCKTAGRCDTEKFVADVNATNLCGYNDWRLPNTDELLSIVDNSRINPSIDTDYFYNTVSSYYWTADPYAADSCCSWVVGFYYGDVRDGNRNSYYFVRGVRVGQ